MRKKSGLTIVEQAVMLVPEFETWSASWINRLLMGFSQIR